MKQKMVLFDWNGTLIDDTPIWHQSISKVFESCRIKPPSLADFVQKWEELKSYPTAVYSSFGVNLNEKEIDQIYLEEYQKHLEEIELTPGIAEILKVLKKRKIILGIVTAQLKPIFDQLFFSWGLERHFDEVITESQKKSSCIIHLCILKRIESQNCYYIGDTPSDIRNAKKAGVNSIAYLTPHIPRELLLSLKPDFAISDLKKIPDIVKRGRRHQ